MNRADTLFLAVFNAKLPADRRAKKGRRWYARRFKMTKDFDPKLIQVPSPLRDYQWNGVTFLLSADAALLADEMGLGKTVQTSIALRLALKSPDCNRALIVAPVSLRMNWEREIRRWAPELAVRRVLGNARDRAATYQLPYPVLITSYEQVRADAPLFTGDVHFDIVVLDEAQRIKNAGSGAALGCKMLPRTRSWALTGIPMYIM